MDNNDFRENAHRIVDWIADYYENIEDISVKPNIKPYEIYNKFDQYPPKSDESFDKIFKDFNSIIMPGMTHWQNPNFFAYFPANTSFPSILAEMLTSAIGAQCMSWITSPAATELEELVMKWLQQMIGLPDSFVGVIQDTASTSTLCAILTARERICNYQINKAGFDKSTYRIYCSEEAHSSLEKAVRIAGIGSDNIVKIKTDDNFAMLAKPLEQSINDDISLGFTPLCVMATLGTTSSTAVDPINEIGKICIKHNIWFHVDAAYSGSAMLLPEMRHFIDGIENADSFVFNPHKWMFTNFDCSAYFVQDKEALVKTFDILPEYLKTDLDSKVNNYRDWGIQLGRRFRALKLWFVIRSYGVEGLKAKIRHHLQLAGIMKDYIEKDKNFEILAPMNFNLICFRLNPGDKSEEDLEKLNSQLLFNINSSSRAFMTHTKLDGKYSIRFLASQTNVEEKHIHSAWELIKKESKKLTAS